MFLKFFFPHKTTTFRLLLTCLEEPPFAAGEGCCHCQTLKILFKSVWSGMRITPFPFHTNKGIVISCRAPWHELQERRSKGQGREGKARNLSWILRIETFSSCSGGNYFSLQPLWVLRIIRVSVGAEGSRSFRDSCSSLPGHHPNSPLLPLFPALLPLTALLLLLMFKLKFPLRCDGT